MIKFTIIILAISTLWFSETLADDDFALSEGLTCSSIDFGHVPMGSFNERLCYISNTGSSSLEINEIKITGIDSSYFKLSGNSFFPFTLHPGEMKSIKIVFNPTTDKAYQAFGEVNSSIGAPCIFVLGGNVFTDIPQNSFNDFSLSPNPARDYIEVTYPTAVNRGLGGISAEIFNILGLVVKEVTSESDKHLIDISGLSPGVYFVRTGDYVQRFIKY